MREGRRQRLGLQEGTEGTVEDTYLDRILEEEGPRTLALDPNAFVDTRDQRYVQDAYNYYLGGGFPEEPEPVIDTPVIDTTPVVDAGGGGGQDLATGGVDTTPTDNLGFDADVTPGPSGFIGLDPDMDVDPQDFAQEDYGMYETPGGQATPGAEFADQNPYGGTGTLDDLGADTFDDFDSGPQPGISNPRAPGQDTVTQDTTIDTTPTAPPGILNPYQEPMTQQDLIDSDANVGFVDAPSFDTPEQTNAIVSAFNSVKDQGLAGSNSFKNKLSNLGGIIKENTVEIGGKTIDIGKSLASGAISILGKTLTGVPGLGLVASLLPEGGRSDMSNALGAQYGMDDIGRLTGGPMAGYAVDSLMGDGIEQATIDRINSIKNRTAPQTESSEKKIQELEEFLEQIERNKTAIDYDMEGTDEGDRAAEEDAAADEEFAVTGDYDVYAGGGADQDPVGPGFGDTDYADPGVDAEENQPEPSSTPSGGGSQDTGAVSTAGQAGPPSQRGGGADMGSVSTAGQAGPPSQRGGGGGGGGGGKIVCTMMNDSYGFGSFRNKIWLKHSKDLAPEYQIGYHKIFLPLVKLSKTNKVLKKTLEHIAVHRTIDIRQEARGKMHLLGRIYRKILEPICYIVGKHAKR